MIYFIQAEDGGPVKIGFTQSRASVQGRLTSLQVGTSRKLVVRGLEKGGKDTEAEIHKRYRDWRIRGEWFHPCAELCDRVGAVNPDVQDAYERGHRTGHREGWNEGYECGLAEERDRTEDIRIRNEEMRVRNNGMGRSCAQERRAFSAMVLAATTREERERYYDLAEPRGVPPIEGITDDERLEILKRTAHSEVVA